MTANEVRKKLAQHYLAENGSSHAVRIDLLPGSYSVEFRWETAPIDALPLAITAVGARGEEGTASETAAAGAQTTGADAETPTVGTYAAAGNETLPVELYFPTHPNWVRRLILAGILVLVLATALGVWRWQAVKPSSVIAKSTPVSNVLPIGAPISENLRMIAGSANPYTDRRGEKWSPDRFYSGGNVIVRPAERIFRTLDPDIYRHLRSGDFQYDIPLAPGNYELHLHFAETGLGAILFT